MLDEVTGKLESTLQENERYRELVARAVNFSEAWSQASDEKAAKLADAAERAIGPARPRAARKRGQGRGSRQARQPCRPRAERGAVARARGWAETQGKLHRQDEMVAKAWRFRSGRSSVADQQPARRGWLARLLTGSEGSTARIRRTGAGQGL